MQDAFTITQDVPRKLLRVTLRGYWDIATAQRFVADCDRTAERMGQQGCPMDQLRILIDRREQPAQSQDVVNALQDFALRNSVKVHKSAVLVASALLKMQSNRINQTGKAQIFASEKEALDWLLAD